MKDPLDYTEAIIKLYLVRHGETKANKLGLIFGQLDWDLNKHGIKEANKAALNLYSKRTKIDHIISSPLKRAQHTASIIAKKLKIKKPIIDKNLTEKSEGLWDGKNYWEVRDNDSQNYYKWLNNPFKNKAPRGESIYDLNKRVILFQKSILKTYIGKTIIVVSHAGPIRLFLLNLLKANLNKFWHLQIDCGGVVEVSLSKKHSTIKMT